MKRFEESRKRFVLLFVVVFFSGMLAGRLFPFVAELCPFVAEFGRSWEVQASEAEKAENAVAEKAESVTAEEAAEIAVSVSEELPLPVVFYDKAGRKVCVRSDSELELWELLKMEIPLDLLKEGQEAKVEIRLQQGQEAVYTNLLHIRRGQLHIEEK